MSVADRRAEFRAALAELQRTHDSRALKLSIETLLRYSESVTQCSGVFATLKPKGKP